jgi:hypothetical protein
MKTRRKLGGKLHIVETPEFLYKSQSDVSLMKQSEKIAILIPFRESDKDNKVRTKHLERFINHFKELKLRVKIYVIEQSDDGRKFNRGALLNIGAEMAKKDGCDSIILHDLDILQGPSLIPYYAVYPVNPVHIAWGISKYTYHRFLGGVLSISMKDFDKVNGYPNEFWGWGGEDDALRNRLIRIGKKFIRPTVKDIAEEQEHPHAGDVPSLVNENKRKQVIEDYGKWRKDGLNSNHFKVIEKKSLGRNMKKVTVEL